MWESKGEETGRCPPSLSPPPPPSRDCPGVRACAPWAAAALLSLGVLAAAEMPLPLGRGWCRALPFC